MQSSRRHFLKHATLGAVAACACCAGAGAALASGVHWTYEGEEGPEHWGDLQADFKSCKIGLEQTPLDLKGAVKATIGAPVATDYKVQPPKILNNGHTIQVNAAPGSSVTIEGESYDLLQFHFHHPSEHLLSGKPFELEVHFVNKSAAGNLAVLGVLVTLGEANPALETVFSAMPASEGEATGKAPIDPTALLPKGRGYFRYYGSLTTPPCSEGLVWTVFKEPITASKAQVEAFAKLFENNARPVQRQNHRYLLDVAG